MTAYFGEAWPSGVCEDGTQVATPVGEHCEMCNEPIQTFDQGSFMGSMHGEEGNWVVVQVPVHRECSLRAVVGGIGHVTNHLHWCGQEHDPDGGLSYRHSALLVWNWVSDHGFSRSDAPRS